MRKFLCTLLVVVLALSSVSALANYNDHTDYVDWPLVKDGENITISVATRRSEKYGVDPDEQWFWIWSETASGLKFDVEQILSSATEERKSLMFASSTLPDLLFGIPLNTSELVRYGMSEGLLLDLSDYITPEIMPNLCAWIEAYPESIAYCTTPDGKIYTLPGYSDFYIVANGSPVMEINTEWLEEAGLDMPATLDDFTATLYKFKELHPDGVPLGGGAKGDARGFLLNAFGYVWPASSNNNLGLEPAVKDGEAVLPVYTETYRDFLELMHQYYADGIISPDFFTLDQVTAFAKLAEDAYGAYPNFAYIALPEKEDFTKWVDITPLTSDWNDVPQIGQVNHFRFGYVALNANMDPAKIEYIMRYLDFFYTDLGGMYMWCGPSATSADTLGIIGGYMVTDEGRYVWLDAEGNPTDSQAFMEGQSGNLSHGFGNRSHPLQNVEAFEAGVTNRPEMRSYFYDANNIIPYSYDPNFGSGAALLNIKKNVDPYRVISYPAYTYFDEDTTLEIDDLHTILDPYVESEVAKFITGARDLSEFDDFQAELKSMGIEELLGYYTQAYAKFVEAQR